MKIKKDPEPEPGFEPGKPVRVSMEEERRREEEEREKEERRKEKERRREEKERKKEERRKDPEENAARRGIWGSFSDFTATHSRISSYAFAGIMWGAIIGAGIVGLFGVATFKLNIQTIYGIFLGAILGAFIGGAIGFISGAMPPGAAKPFVTLVILLLILFLGYTAILAGMTGVIPVYMRRAAPTFGGVWEAFKGGIRCFTSAEGFSKCFIEPFQTGWETERKEEEVALELDFKTTSLFYDGKDKKIEAELTVINKPESGIERFLLEPECYVENEKTESESSGLKEGGKLVFLQRATPQIASIICSVPSSTMKGKKNINAEIKLIRPVVSSAEWTLWTLEQDSIFELIERGEAIPGEGQPKGSVATYIGIPYTFGIGVRESQPLTEGEHNLYIELNKKVGISGDLKEIEFLKVLGVGETASITNCEGFKKKGDAFEIENIGGKDIEEIEKGKTFSCKLEVSPEEFENKVVFKAQISYLLEIDYPTSLLILGSEVSEEK